MMAIILVVLWIIFYTIWQHFFVVEVINEIDEIIMIFTRITIDKNQMTIFFKLMYIYIYINLLIKSV